MMKHSIIRRSDAETQRTRTHKQPRTGRWPLATLAGLILAAVTVPPAWSAVTNPPTGPINGTVPFLKTEEPERSRLYVADQDGKTVGTTPENSIVNMDHTPSSFKASTTETLDIFPDDLDGDCDTTGGFRPACDVAVGGTTNRVWKFNGNLLNDVMLSSAFKTYFAGKTLSVVITAPVTTTSHTGVERVGTNPLSSDEALVYVPTVPGIYVGTYPNIDGGSNYYWDPLKPTPFPTTAALGMKFTIYMGSDDQSDYKFETDQPSWTSVGMNTGVVTFTAVPTSATKTVKVKVTQIAAPHAVYTYTFTVRKWFDTVRVSKGTSMAPSAMSVINPMCAVKGMRAAGYSADARGPGPASSFRVVPGAFAAEWGVGQRPTGWSDASGGPSFGGFGMAVIDTPLGSEWDGEQSRPFSPLAIGGVRWSEVLFPGASPTYVDGYAKEGAWLTAESNVDLICVKDLL